MANLIENGVIYDCDYGRPDLWDGTQIPAPHEKPFISEEKLQDLQRLGIIGSEDIRGGNVGSSNYAEHTIQPWAIWLDYDLNPWDADIVKRILRTKEEPGMSPTESRILDYQKIIHICQERIRQLNG